MLEFLDSGLDSRIRPQLCVKISVYPNILDLNFNLKPINNGTSTDGGYKILELLKKQ